MKLRFTGYSSTTAWRRLGVLPLVLALGTGCFARQKDLTALETQTQERGKVLDRVAKENESLRQDLEALRQRLDTALRAHADSGSTQTELTDQLTKANGKNDELSHQVDTLQKSLDQVQKDLAQSRTELYARIDEVKRATAPAPPPPVTIPQDKKAHFAVTKDAWQRKDWSALRQLAPEYALRYPTDEFADDALYFTGDGDLKDNRPSSAIGWFNRVLRGYPKSNQMAITLSGMGNAYLALHDCENAKLAFQVCESKFPKDAAGKDAKAQLVRISQDPPGLCGK